MIYTITQIILRNDGSTDLAVGEPCINGSRLAIGKDPNVGNPFTYREEWPEKHFEILSETSPRLKTLFGQFHADRHRSSRAIPFHLGGNSGWVNLGYATVEGAFPKPVEIEGTSCSACVNYTVFQNRAPIKISKFRILARGASIMTDDNHTVDISSPYFSIRATYVTDQTTKYYSVQVKNDSSDPMTIVFDYSSVL